VIGPYLVAVSATVSAAASAFAWRHALAGGKARGGNVAAMTAQLKRVPLAERPKALLERAPEGSWQKTFASEIVEAPTEAWKVAAANDAISDLAHALDLRAGWPRAAARVAAAAAFLGAIVAYIVDRELDHTLAICVPGAIAIVLCVEAGRRAKDAAKACRKDMDALVEVVMGDVAREQAEKSELRRRRRREGW
jgi:hypothetical protein